MLVDPDMSLSNSCWTCFWPIRVILHSLFTHLASPLNSKLSACSRPAGLCGPCQHALPGSLTHYLLLLQSRLRKLACVKPLFSATCNFPKRFPSGLLLFLPQVRPKVLWAPPLLSEGHSETMSRGHRRGPRPSFPLKGMLGSLPSFFLFSSPTHLIFSLPCKKRAARLQGGWPGRRSFGVKRGQKILPTAKQQGFACLLGFRVWLGGSAFLSHHFLAFGCVLGWRKKGGGVNVTFPCPHYLPQAGRLCSLVNTSPPQQCPHAQHALGGGFLWKAAAPAFTAFHLGHRPGG